MDRRASNEPPQSEKEMAMVEVEQDEGGHQLRDAAAPEAPSSALLSPPSSPPRKDDFTSIPADVLSQITPSVARLLRVRQVMRVVGFFAFGLVGKMCLFSLILPFWGETKTVVNVTSSETTTLHVGLLFKYASDGPDSPTFTHWAFFASALLVTLSIVSLAANGIIYEYCRREIHLGNKHERLHWIAVSLPVCQILLQVGAFLLFGHYAMPTQMDSSLSSGPYEWSTSIYGGSIYELFVILSLEACQFVVNLVLALVVHSVPDSVLQLDASGDVSIAKLAEYAAGEKRAPSLRSLLDDESGGSPTE